MKKSNIRLSKYPIATGLNALQGVGRIPGVGGKMFRRTSESAGSIR